MNIDISRIKCCNRFSKSKPDSCCAGKQKQYLQTSSRTEELVSETVCDGGRVSLACDHGKVVSVVRAVWGRYSRAVCHDGSSGGGLVSRGVGQQCGDTSLSRRLLISLCQGKQHCQVDVNTETFGDPCPDTTEFLEVQYQCVPQKTEIMMRQPLLTQDIAQLWDHNDVRQRQVTEELLLDQYEALEESLAEPLRIPITEPSTAVEPFLTKHEDHVQETEVRLIQEYEERVVFACAMICLLLLPVVVSLTIILVKTKSSSRQSSHSFDSSQDYPCLLEQSGAKLIYCRHDQSKNSDMNMTRQYCSEPALTKHCLLESFHHHK